MTRAEFEKLEDILYGETSVIAPEDVPMLLEVIERAFNVTEPR